MNQFLRALKTLILILKVKTGRNIKFSTSVKQTSPRVSLFEKKMLNYLLKR